MQIGSISAYLTDLLIALDGAVGIQEEDVYRTGVRLAVIVQMGTHGQIRHAVPIQVPECRHAEAKEVALAKLRPVAGRLTDLLIGLDRAVGVHE